jgi:hypothetical protein
VRKEQHQLSHASYRIRPEWSVLPPKGLPKGIMRLSVLYAVLAVLAVSASGAAPTPADSALQRDTLATRNAPAAVVPGASPESPDAPALAPELSPRERIRQERIAEREAYREERLQRRAAIRASRDSARRLDNFYLGAGLASSQYAAHSGTDSEFTETSSPMGIWFGYRTHFARMLGLRVGGLAHFGSTEVERGSVDPIFPSSSYGYQASGSRGMTFEIDASAQAILGPFGRFTLEPGFFYGFGWHTAKYIELDNGFGNPRYEPRPRFSVAGWMLGASLLFGSRDQFSPTGQLAFGKALGSADAAVFTMGLGFTFAFQDG